MSTAYPRSRVRLRSARRASSSLRVCDVSWGSGSYRFSPSRSAGRSARIALPREVVEAGSSRPTRLIPRRYCGDSKALRPEAAEVLDRSIAVLEGLTDFSPEAQQEALRAVLVDEMGIKPRFAFAPLRVAVTGRRRPEER